MHQNPKQAPEKKGLRNSKTAALVIRNEIPGVSPKLSGWREMEKSDKYVQAQA